MPTARLEGWAKRRDRVRKRWGDAILPEPEDVERQRQLPQQERPGQGKSNATTHRENTPTNADSLRVLPEDCPRCQLFLSVKLDGHTNDASI